MIFYDILFKISINKKVMSLGERWFQMEIDGIAHFFRDLFYLLNELL
jgi:hypothetical protein